MSFEVAVVHGGFEKLHLDHSTSAIHIDRAPVEDQNFLGRDYQRTGGDTEEIE